MKNLLKQATHLIPMDDVIYYKYSSKALDDVGREVLTFASPLNIKANVQAVSRNRYVELGLDLNKKYVTIFTYENMQDVDRDKSGDKFIYNGETFKVESETDWLAKDLWTYYTAVRID